MNCRFRYTDDAPGDDGKREVACTRCSGRRVRVPAATLPERVLRRCTVPAFGEYLAHYALLFFRIEPERTLLVHRGALAMLRSFFRPIGGGPGDVLEVLIRDAGYGAGASGCQSCKAHVDEMNAAGVDWCREHLPAIVGWLAAKADERGLPFDSWGASLLVRRALWIAAGRSWPERALLTAAKWYRGWRAFDVREWMITGATRN